MTDNSDDDGTFRSPFAINTRYPHLLQRNHNMDYERITKQENDDCEADPPVDLYGSTNTAGENFEMTPSPLDSLHELDHEHGDHELITIDNAVEALGMGSFQRYMMATLGLFFAADAMQVSLLSFLMVVLREDWNLSPETTATITSLLFAGSLFGAISLGPLADSIGRRPVFLMASLIVTVFGLAASLAPNPQILAFLFFMVGVGVGGLTIPYDILAEFVPSSGRGTNLLSLNYFWTLGSLFVVVIAYATLHGKEDYWRYFVAICPLPCFISLVAGYLYIPESARWLVTKGRTDEAMAILRRAAAVNGHDVNFVFPPHIALAPELHKEETVIADLFKPKWRKFIWYIWGTWGLSAFGYYGTILTITNVFSELPSDESTTNGGDYDFDFSAIFVSGAAEFLGTTLAIAAVDRMGRIPSQVVSYALAGISISLLCILASLRAPRLLLVTLGFSARIFEMSGTCLTWVSTTEVLTTEVRMTGLGISSAVARVGAFFCPYVVDGTTPLLYIGIIMLLTHTFTAWFASHIPETKGLDMGVATANLDDDEEQEGELAEDHDDEVTHDRFL
jgi:MFS family permease